MPIKWYGNGDSEDPIYKHFSRIVKYLNLGTSEMIYRSKLLT